MSWHGTAGRAGSDRHRRRARNRQVGGPAAGQRGRLGGGQRPGRGTRRLRARAPGLRTTWWPRSARRAARRSPAARTSPTSAAAEGLIGTAIEEFGRLDVLVNVAGILRDRMIFNMTEQEWDDVIRVHLKGTFNTTRFASAHWRSLRDETAQNRIINFTSVSGLHGAPGQPNYAAAKMGIVGLTYSSARSLAQVRGHRERDLARRRHPDDRLGADGAPPVRGPQPPTCGRRTTWRRSSPTWPRSAPAGSTAGSSTRRATRSRSTTTPSRSAGSSAPAPGTPTPLSEQVERAFGPILGRKA